MNESDVRSTPPNILIMSLPRSGSTTMAHLLECHDRVRCLIEPFHPRRYQGRYHDAVTDDASLSQTLDLIYSEWTAIKHVFEADGWPFSRAPERNEKMLMRPNTRVLFLIRRNLLKRVVSNLICRQTQFWIGPKEEFHRRLEGTQLREFRPHLVKQQIARDAATNGRFREFLLKHGVEARTMYYEELFDVTSSREQQFELLNSILGFLGYSPLERSKFEGRCERLFDPDKNQFASSEVYQRIPGIHQLEAEVGSPETGFLFSD